ncbi:unnamed protein product, partial [Laminaria digitata]
TPTLTTPTPTPARVLRSFLLVHSRKKKLLIKAAGTTERAISSPPTIQSSHNTLLPYQNPTLYTSAIPHIRQYHTTLSNNSPLLPSTSISLIPRYSCSSIKKTKYVFVYT